MSETNGAIPIDAMMTGILRSLLAERDGVDAKIVYFLQDCAKKGVSLEEYAFDRASQSFIPKPEKAPGVAVL